MWVPRSIRQKLAMGNSAAGWAILVLGVSLLMLLSSASASTVRVSEGYSHTDSAKTLYSSINFLKCTSDMEVTVSSTQEISDLLKQYKDREPGTVKMRATHRGFHSSTGLVCAGTRGSSAAEHSSDDSGPATGGRLLSITALLHLMNRVVGVEGLEMTVEAGMTLRELVVAAEERGLSVPPGALSGYANLTVGGVVLSSAHGSGYRTSSTLGALITKMRWVDASGEIVESDKESEQGAREIRALVGGIGLLGIVTEITFKLQPNSRTIVEVRKRLPDANMVVELQEILENETPIVNAFWRPDSGLYKALLWKQVEDGEYDPATMPPFYPNGTIAMLAPLPEQAANTLRELMAAWEDDARDELPSAKALNAGICKLGEMVVNSTNFTDGNGTPIEHGTIPTNNAMVAADCHPKCVFNVHYTGSFTEDIEFTIKHSKFQEWVHDVKLIVRTELNDRCMAPGLGSVIRFGAGDENLLSTSTGSEDVVYVQPSMLHSAMIPGKLSKMSTMLESIEQLTLCKYQGRPHWGKNHERIVRHPKCKVLENYPPANVEALLKMQRKHDPKKVFEPDLFSEMLAGSGPVYSPVCTAHYWCYCVDDWHCPSGYTCGVSESFPEYHICRLARTKAFE